MSLLEELQTALRDRYDVVGEIGRGGMATVFRARDLRHDRDVAIKLLSPDLSATIGAERFQREIQIAARLAHPNILPVHDSGEAAGLLYYVMPLVEGESLRDRLDRETQLGVEDAVAIACEVADALGYAHEHGVVHRDVKPENILLSDGHAVVADFGIARITDAPRGQTLTATGMSVGTACYMSPEQFSGEPVDGRSDVYSLGVVLYEMLVGQVPFTGPTAIAVMARAIVDPPPAIHVVRAAVPEEIELAVYQALEKAPADRFRRMRDFKEALLGGQTSSYAARTARYTARYAAARAAPAAAHRRWVRAAAVGVTLLLVGGGFAMRLRWLSGGRTLSAAGSIDANRVGVLYFEDLSPKHTLGYLADGLTENLIDQLSQVSALDVVSRNAARLFRGASVSADSVGRVLRVGSIVRGSVEPHGSGVKVTVRLVDAASDVDLAKKSFDADTRDAVKLQGEVAEQVASFLREQLGDEVRLKEERRATRSNDAWLAVQRANRQYESADSLAEAGALEPALAAYARADTLLVAAARADPSWPVPPAMRAEVAYGVARALGRDPARSAAAAPRIQAAVDSGLARAREALALDPRDADALEYRGGLLFERYKILIAQDPKGAALAIAEAETTLKRAVDINRYQAGAWAILSNLYYRKPDLQLAMDAASRAYGADMYLSSARDILKSLFQTNYNLEQFPEAIRWCREGRQRFPADPFFALCRVIWYTSRGQQPAPDPDSAWAWRARYLALVPPAQRPLAELRSMAYVAGALVRAGQPDSAKHVLSEIGRRDTPEIDPKREMNALQAFVYTMMGDQDRAVELIKGYITLNPAHARGFATRTMWWWRDLQDNPHFVELMKTALAH